jgi:hypothetical protein
MRWAAEGRGKRGGFRRAYMVQKKLGAMPIIYYFHSETFPLFFLTIYPKNQKANLTKAERNEFKKLVRILIRRYAKGRKV